MPLLGFKRQFAAFVEEGSKEHTIRASRSIPIRVGDVLHCYVNPRQKAMRLLGRWKCTAVSEIRIWCDSSLPSSPLAYPTPGPFNYRVEIDGADLDFQERDLLAWRDGFRFGSPDSGEVSQSPKECFRLMIDFWMKTHGGQVPLDFHGQIIYWDSRKTEAGKPGQKAVLP